MPLVYQQNINACTKIAVWHITESESFFIGKNAIENNINHPLKRLQHLAGRFLLKWLYEDFPIHQIELSDSRKPYLNNGQYYFSISHAGNYAAVIVSKEHCVGIDIEFPRSKIAAIKHKFLTEIECNVLSFLSVDLMHQYTLAWCIKEAVFKWYGEGAVDFKKHISIESIEESGEMLNANCVFNKIIQVPLIIQAVSIEGNYLSWVCK